MKTCSYCNLALQQNTSIFKNKSKVATQFNFNLKFKILNTQNVVFIINKNIFKLSFTLLFAICCQTVMNASFVCDKKIGNADYVYQLT